LRRTESDCRAWLLLGNETLVPKLNKLPGRRLLWFPLLDPVLFRIGGLLPGLTSRRTLLRGAPGSEGPYPRLHSLDVELERAVPE